jgi:hypothetical protein
VKLKTQIEANEKKIKSAQAVYNEAARAYDFVVRPIKIRENEILNKFRIIINESIKAEHHCDHCDARLFDSAVFTSDGISMRMDADHPNDRIDQKWTWEEIETLLV